VASKTLLIAVVALLAIAALIYLSSRVVVVDTEEDLWPDPRARQMVHMGVLSRRLQAAARYDGRLPDSLAEFWPSDTTITSFAVDLWSTQLLYQHRETVFVLRSAGPDRRFDTMDDILLCDGTTYAAKRALAGGGLIPGCDAAGK
jgi:hypothetical protein